VQLRARGVTVFLSTHILEIAERMADRVVIIDKGAIVAAGTLPNSGTAAPAPWRIFSSA
jgi:ABC-2 type transport system ATP-binding protein